MGLTKNLGWLSKYITADSSGQIGIGTVTPTSTLDLQNATTPQIDFHTGANKRADIRATAGSLFLNSITGNDIQLQTDSSTKVLITSAGNVGIGTGVPSSKVHIEGLFGTSGDAFRIQNTTGATTGNRLNIDFWFKSAAWTNARTAQIAAVTTDSYWPNTDISFSTNANTSATALKEVMRVRQDGAVSNKGVLTQYASGSAQVDSTFYFDFVAFPSTTYKVMAGITHWNAGYGAYSELIQFNDAYSTISTVTIANHTSAAGGSWSISRPDNVTLRVTHNAGNFAGGANFWIQVIGV
jgi:hypothetical protein